MFRRRTVISRRSGSPLLGTALVGGAAYMSGKSSANASMREAAQEQRLSALEQQNKTNQTPAALPQAPAQMPQPVPPPAPMPAAHTPTPDKLSQLKTLGELRSSGVLTDEEFEREKQKILRE